MKRDGKQDNKKCLLCDKLCCVYYLTPDTVADMSNGENNDKTSKRDKLQQYDNPTMGRKHE